VPDPLTLVIAMPPSTNGLYANLPGRGRVKTRAYKTWLTEAGWQLKQQPRHSFPGDVEVEIRIGPRNRAADASNRIKATEDLLTAHGIIVDDKHVVKVSAEWSNDVKGCQVDIREVVQEARA